MSGLAKTRAIQALQDYRNALTTGGDDSEPLSRLEQYLDLVDAETRSYLSNTMAKLEASTANEKFKELAKVAEKFAPLQDAFKLGEKMAKEGKSDLFFPTVAAQLSQVAVVVNEIAEVAKKVQDSAKDVETAFNEAFDKNDVEALAKEAKGIRDTVNGLLKTFGSLQEKLPG